jgi:hypothetical protein
LLVHSFYLDFESVTVVDSLSFDYSPSLLSCDGLSCYSVPYVSGYTNTTFFAVQGVKVGVTTDAIGSSSDDKECYIYVDSWSDNSVTLKLVCPAGWIMAGSLMIIG